jgi:hypothetical protein
MAVWTDTRLVGSSVGSPSASCGIRRDLQLRREARTVQIVLTLLVSRDFTS